MRKQIDVWNRISLTILAVGLLCLSAGPAHAQVSPGLSSISGLVVDNSGATVPDAQVVVSNEAIGVKFVLTTSSGGVFNAPALAPAGGYDVTVNKSGFAAYEAKDLALTVGQELNLVVHLGVSGVSEQVQVVAAEPVVDTTKTDVSQVVNADQIQDYPLNGRRADQFALLTPGVAPDSNFGLLSFRGIANGNTFLLDGGDSTEQFYVENNGRTRITSQISLDAVQEFQVVSTDYSAEYGRASGGVVNTVIRSGTNSLHGSAFGFFRNQDLMARDPFTPMNFPIPSQWRLQSGGSIGGPIIKDKLFFFVSTEFMRNNFPLEDVYNSQYINQATASPTFNRANSNASLDCVVGAGSATAAQCAAIDAFLPPFFGGVARSASQNEALAKLDWHPNDRNALNVSFNYMYFNSPNGLQQTVATSTSGAALNGNGNDFARVRNGRATWNYFISSSVVNTLRYGWNTDLQGDNPSGNSFPSLGLLDVCVGSSGGCGSGVHLGQTNFLPRVEPDETRNEVLDDLSWTRGRHSFKFGADFATTRDFSIFLANLNGQYNYATPTAFAEDFSGTTTGKHWQMFTQAFGNADLTTRINEYGFYAEDQWRVTGKLTANLGARYDYTQIPKAPTCNAAYAPTCAPINSPTTNIAPRIGLAYRLNDKTVIRAGYGMFYARLAASTLQDLYTSGIGIASQSVSISSPAATGAPVYPNVLKAPPGANSSSLNLQFTAPNFTTPYSQQANLAVERDLTHGFGLTVSYIWSNGIHLYSVTDLNMPSTTIPVTFPIYSASPTAGGVQLGAYTTNVTTSASLTQSGVRPNPTFGALDQDGNAVTMNYNALAIQLHKAFSHGLMADLSYTLSHELDDGQGFGQGTSNLFLSNNFSWLQNGVFKPDYGNGEEDVPQRAVLSWAWAPTFTHRNGAFYDFVVNNWQLSSITTLNGSRPYGSANVSLSGTPVSTADGYAATMFSNFSLNGTGLSGRVPWWPINSVNEPAIYREDIRVTKSFPFKERYRVDVGLEVFNLFNTWAPTVPQTGNAYTASFNSTLKQTIIVPAEAQVTGIYPPPANYGVFAGCSCSDSWPVDGTEARRLQVMGRFTF